MTETPWQSYSCAAPERDYVALVSYLPLNSAWSLPRLIVYSTRIQRQLRTSSGLIGYSLRARLAAKQFWTLSVWEDGAALQAFVAEPPHVAVMKAMAPATASVGRRVEPLLLTAPPAEPARRR
jgi:quinol monooxygenase YgiN